MTNGGGLAKIGGLTKSDGRIEERRSFAVGNERVARAVACVIAGRFDCLNTHTNLGQLDTQWSSFGFTAVASLEQQDVFTNRTMLT